MVTVTTETNWTMDIDVTIWSLNGHFRYFPEFTMKLKKKNSENG